MATGTVKYLNHKGHGATVWDTEKPETVKTAMDEFEAAMQGGATAFDTSSPAGGVPLKNKKITDVSDVTVVPRMAGG